MQKYRSYLIYAFFLVGAVLALDIWTKQQVVAYFQQTSSVSTLYPVLTHFWGIDFSIVYTSNKGAAWGMLSSWPSYLLAIRIASVVFLASFLLFINQSLVKLFPLALILAGALGNVIDSFVYGHVVDMFFFKFWTYEFAVFNIADAAISLGIFLLIIQSYREFRKQALYATITQNRSS